MQISTYANCSTSTQVLTYLKEAVERSWQRYTGYNMSLSEERGRCFPGQTISVRHGLIPQKWPEVNECKQVCAKDETGYSESLNVRRLFLMKRTWS